MGAPEYDLREQPWLPVRAGELTSRVGLREVLTRAHLLEDLAVPVPPAATGLWRILYAIAARVTGLDSSEYWYDIAAWKAHRTRIIRDGQLDPDAVTRYLDTWAGRFDLFDRDRPWLQEPRLRDECPWSSGINKLVIGRPAGNTQVWFGHFADQDPVAVPSAEAAWYLVAQLYHGAAGTCTPRTVNGTSASKLTAAPLRCAISYHPAGRTIFESLLAGLPAPIGDQDSTTPTDRCPWETNELPDPLAAPPPATWPGGMLTGRARHAVLLMPSHDGESVVDAYVTWAYRLRAPDVEDPYVVRRLNKDGVPYAKRASSDRALWRDLDGLLHYTTDGESGPAAMQSGLSVPYADEVRVRAYGFDQDGQAKDNQWYTATTPAILPWLEESAPEAWLSTRDLRVHAEAVESQMRSFLRGAWREVANGDKKTIGPWPARAAAYFWPRAEREFWRRLNAGDFEGHVTSFLRIADDAISHAVGNQDRQPRVARAVAVARRRLFGMNLAKENA